MRSRALKPRWRAGMFASATIVLGMAATGPLRAQQAPPDFTAIVQQSAPSAVAITTKQMIEERGLPEDLPFGELFRHGFSEPGQPHMRARQALGSGFLFSRDGYVVTNSHVVGDATEIHVVFLDKTNVPAKLVGCHPASDAAVLKIDPKPNMTIAAWGNSDAIEPGAWTVAIGNPFGFGGTVTVGVLSARSRDIHAGPYDDFLQTDASINQDNSGGPLLNAQGEVIGVNTAIFSPSGGNLGIGFAIPSKTAQAVGEHLIQSGRVERGYLGVQLQELSPALAQALGMQDEKGALVAAVEPGSPAERIDLKTGDVITRFNGRPVDSPRSLSRAVADQLAGTQANITVLRGGRQQDLTGTIGQWAGEATAQGGEQGGQNQGKRLGLALSPVPESDRTQLKLEPGASGVEVQRVEPDSPAADSGIQPRAVIVAANNRPVTQPSDVAEEWQKSRQQNKPILLRVMHGDQYQYVAVGA